LIRSAGFRGKLSNFVNKAVNQASVSIGNLITIPVAVPSLMEQRRIAAILDKADALRQKRRTALQKLDSLTQSIFLDMFGDPATNPKGWPITTIRELLESASYGSSEKASDTGKYPMLRMNNLTFDGRMNLSALKYIDLPAEQEERWLVREGDILFNRTNSPDLVGKTAVFRHPEPMAYAGYLVRLRVNQEATSEFISAFLNSRYGKATLRGMCKSIIGMANINATEVQTIRIPKPPVELQRTFARLVIEMETHKRRQLSSEASMDAQFSSLQHRAFRGEL
jgi:type I restriction enzyme S subunit